MTIDKNELINQLEKLVVERNEELEKQDKEIERLNLILRAIKKECEVKEYYELTNFIEQLENEKVDSKWLERVAGDKE